MTAQLKVSSFYGAGVARPYLVFDSQGKPLTERVDQPRVNDALIEWGSKVPFEAGGLLMRPKEWQGQTPGKARREFAIFEEECRGDILAANPSLMSGGTAQEFHLAASEYWHDKLAPAERQAYKERAAAERSAVREAAAQLAETDPAYSKHVAAEASYKNAKGAIISAARAASGPLWRIQRRVNATLHGKAAVAADKKKARRAAAGNPKKRPSTTQGRKLRAIVRKRPSKKIPVRSKKHQAIRAARAATTAAREAEAAEQQQEEGAPEEQRERPDPSSRRLGKDAAAGAAPVYTGEFDVGVEESVEEDFAGRRTTRSQQAAAAAAGPSSPAKPRHRRKPRPSL